MGDAQKRIALMKIRTGYFKASKLTRGKGGLPSNVLLDDYLAKTGQREAMKESFPIWAREILVYPEKDGQFKKGRDVVDSRKDRKGRKWILPANYVPLEARGREKVGLFVDPEEVREEKGNVVVHPKSVVVLSGFIQELGKPGKADENTRIPLEVDPELWKNLPDEEKRSLFRLDGVGVRPLVRDEDWQKVYAHHRPDRGFGVAYFGPEETRKEPEPEVTPDEFGKLLKDAKASLVELSRLVPHQKLEAIRRIIQALETKE